MAKRSGEFTITAKAEKLPGAYSNPTLADALQAVNPSYDVEQQYITTEYAQASLDPQFEPLGLSNDKVTFGLDLRGSGELPNFTGSVAPTRLPRFALLMQACGFRARNAMRLECTGLTALIDANTLVFGEMSGAKARLLMTNASAEHYLVLEPLNRFAFRAGEVLHKDTVAGTSVGSVANNTAAVVSGPFGWLLRPISKSIYHGQLSNATPSGGLEFNGTETVPASEWRALAQGFGDYISIRVPHTKHSTPAGTVLTGATTGAQVRTIEDTYAGLQLHITGTLGSTNTAGTTITGAGGATGTLIGDHAIGASTLYIKKVNGTAYVAGEVLSGFAGAETQTLAATAILAGLLQEIRAQATGDLTKVLSGHEVLLGTGAASDPTISWIETTLELTIPFTGGLAGATAVTGATSTATGPTDASTTTNQGTQGVQRIIIRRTSAAQFVVGETLSGTGISPTPIVAAVLNTYLHFPRDLVVMEGVTSGGKLQTSHPNNDQGYGYFDTPFSTGSAPVANTRVLTSDTDIYYEPFGSDLVAGEVIKHSVTDPITGVVTTTSLKQLSSTWDPAAFQGPTLSIEYNIDGVLKGMVGAKGTAKIDGTAGETVRTTFDFLGRHNVPSDRDQPLGLETIPAGNPDFSDTPAPLRLASWELGHDSCVGSVSIDFGLTNVTPRCGQAPDGIKSIEITARKPVITVTPELLPVAIKNWIAQMRSATSGLAVNRVYYSSPHVLGNTFVFCAPNTQLKGVKDDSRDGVAVSSLTLEPKASTVQGNDHCWMLMI